MDFEKLLRLLAKSTGLELKMEPGADGRHHLTLKFDEKDDAYMAFEQIGDLQDQFDDGDDAEEE